MNCRLCQSKNLLLVVDLGKMPIAHRLLTNPDEFESVYPFRLFRCAECDLIQIADPIDPDILYRSYNYNFSSWKFEPHIDDELNMLIALGPYKSAFEIGSNDGLFLQKLRDKGIPTVTGTEPNPVACRIAAERGLTVFNDMINRDVVRQAIDANGRFDLVVSRQVIEHVPNLDNFFNCIDALLTDDGVLFLDFPDFDVNLEATDCSVFWEEHVSYFTENSMAKLLKKHGFLVLEVRRYDFSGGVMTIAAKRVTAFDQSITMEFDATAYQLRIEQYQNLIPAYQSELKSLLRKARELGYEVAIYGVGVRACSVVNGLRLGELIDFALDDQKERQGKYLPGSKLEIRPRESLRTTTRPLLILLAVNNENEVKVLCNITADQAIIRPIVAITVCGPKDVTKELIVLNEALSGGPL